MTWFGEAVEVLFIALTIAYLVTIPFTHSAEPHGA